MVRLCGDEDRVCGQRGRFIGWNCDRLHCGGTNLVECSAASHRYRHLGWRGRLFAEYCHRQFCPVIIDPHRPPHPVFCGLRRPVIPIDCIILQFSRRWHADDFDAVIHGVRPAGCPYGAGEGWRRAGSHQNGVDSVFGAIRGQIVLEPSAGRAGEQRADSLVLRLARRGDADGAAGLGKHHARIHLPRHAIAFVAEGQDQDICRLAERALHMARREKIQRRPGRPGEGGGVRRQGDAGQGRQSQPRAAPFRPVRRNR